MADENTEQNENENTEQNGSGQQGESEQTQIHVPGAVPEGFANKSYLCKDAFGQEPILHFYLFSIKPNNRFMVTQNPTEMGMVRQDNIVEQPESIVVQAMAQCTKEQEKSPLGNGNSGSLTNDEEEEFKDEDGTDWHDVLYGFSLSHKLVSIIDHNRIHENLVIDNIDCVHSTSLPDLDVFTLHLSNIMDASRLDGESDSDEGGGSDGGGSDNTQSGVVD